MFNAGRTLTGGTLVLPLKVVAHPESIAIVGGYVYRGTDVPALRGYYLYSDNRGPWIRGIRLRDGKRALQFNKRAGGRAASRASARTRAATSTSDLRRHLPDREWSSLDVAGRFADASGYLNTASFGLPPDTAWAAFTAAAESWRDGRRQPQDYDATITAAPGRVRAPAARAGVVGGDRPPGVADDRPRRGVAARRRRGGGGRRPVHVDAVPVPRAGAPRGRGAQRAVRPRRRRGHGRDVAGRGRGGALRRRRASPTWRQIRAAARDHDARVLADTTQATGWLDIDASGLDYVVCSAYKWLLSPRGTAFMSVSPEAAETLIPHAAGWYAGDDIWDSIYGAPLRLADTARRFDISPAWLMWVGTLPALEMLEEIGIAAIGAHGIELANRLRGHLGLPPSDSPIVSVAVDGRQREAGGGGHPAGDRGGRRAAVVRPLQHGGRRRPGSRGAGAIPVTRNAGRSAYGEGARE